jgi:hypothetical protein
MMLTYHNEEVLPLNFDESAVLSLEWVNQSTDLHVKLDWLDDPSIDSDAQPTLAFAFVTHFEAQFAFPPGKMGTMEIGTIRFSRLESETWSVEIAFYFQPVGHIRFHCDDILFSHS